MHPQVKRDELCHGSPRVELTMQGMQSLLYMYILTQNANE